MRVLLWSELFWPYVGGAELFVARLMVALRERGHEFLVVTSHDYLDLPDEARYEGIPIHRLPLRSVLASRDLKRLREVKQRVAALKRTFAPDVVHASAVGPSLFFHLRTIDAHAAPWLFTLTQEVLPSQAAGQGTLLYQALVSASWVAGCSETVLAQARRLAPEITPRSSPIRNCVDLPTRSPSAVPAGPPRLLCLGRLVHAKGFDVALAAFATLVQRFPTLRLTMAGDGAARHELERQVAALGLEGA
jgi:glycogen(starch) synthase